VQTRFSRQICTFCFGPLRVVLCVITGVIIIGMLIRTGDFIAIICGVVKNWLALNGSKLTYSARQAAEVTVRQGMSWRDRAPAQRCATMAADNRRGARSQQRSVCATGTRGAIGREPSVCEASTR
jgi:hypothetical protein